MGYNVPLGDSYILYSYKGLNMRPEIKAAIEALQALENVTTEEYTSIKNEVNSMGEKVKANECKRIFNEQVLKSNSKILDYFIDDNGINAISFERIEDGDGDFLGAVVLKNNSDSYGFIVYCSENADQIDTDYISEIYPSDTSDELMAKLYIYGEAFSNEDVENFKSTIELFTKDAYTLDLFELIR